MEIEFRIIEPTALATIVPLLYQLNEGAISEETLLKRTLEMANQYYECLGMYDGEQLIGVCGMWFQTRHYAGKSCEIDHVIIKNAYRNRGIGGRMMDFVYGHARKKNCNWVELNTYVDNFASHKFYNNQDFVAKGYHFVKDIRS